MKRNQFLEFMEKFEEEVSTPSLSSWTELSFGQYQGKTLPQILFSDPDYFFHLYEKSEGFWRSPQPTLAEEAKTVCDRATHIRIPGNENRRLVAEYIYDPRTRKFDHLDIIEAGDVNFDGYGATFRLPYLSLSVAHHLCPYDKLGSKRLVRQVKSIIFIKANLKMTRRRCEEFFEDETNFFQPPPPVKRETRTDSLRAIGAQS